MHGRVPLHDGAGIIVAVGSDVARWKPGDRVVANPNQLWTAGEPGPDTVGATLGLSADGTLGVYIALPEHCIVALPVIVSLEDAASIPCAGLSAWNGLMGRPTRRAVAPGSTILTLGNGRRLVVRRSVGEGDGLPCHCDDIVWNEGRAVDGDGGRCRHQLCGNARLGRSRA